MSRRINFKLRNSDFDIMAMLDNLHYNKRSAACRAGLRKLFELPEDERDQIIMREIIDRNRGDGRDLAPIIKITPVRTKPAIFYPKGGWYE